MHFTLMKHLISIFFTAICATVLLHSCTIDEIDTFSGGSQVYFERSAGSGTADSLTYSFAVQPAGLMNDIVRIPIVVTGEAVPYDRIVNIEVDRSLTTATEGKEYTFSQVTIPAGSFSTTLDVAVNRTPAIAEEERYITFRILPSEGLEIDVNPAWIDYKLKINDILTRPARWVYECQPYFGVYSRVKYRFIIDTLGLWDFPDSGENAIPRAQMYFYKDKMKSALAKWTQENGPMLDENGNVISFN